MKAQSKPKYIVKPTLSLNKKEVPQSKQNSSLLGKKIKAPITEERKNKFKSPDKLNKLNLSDIKFSKDKNKSLAKSQTSVNPLNKSLSLNSNNNKSNFNKKIFTKPALNLKRINTSNSNKILNLKKEKPVLSNLQNIKPINRNIIAKSTLAKAKAEQPKIQNFSQKKKQADSELENAKTPMKDGKSNLSAFCSPSAEKSNSYEKQTNKTKSVKSQKGKSTNKKSNNVSGKSGFCPDTDKNINIFDSAYITAKSFKSNNFDFNDEIKNNIFNTQSGFKESSSSKPKQSRVSFLGSASRFLDENDYGSAEKYVFKSSAKKLVNKTPQIKENYGITARKNSKHNNNSSNKKKNKSFNNELNRDQVNVEDHLRSESPKKNKLLSGKRSKTKSFISNLSKEKTLTKSDKKSIKSIKDSVKKINFDDEAMIKHENEAKSLSFTSEKKKRNNVNSSRSRSITKSKEKKLLNHGKRSLIKESLNDKTIKKDLSNKIENKKIPNKKYETVKSKVGQLLKVQNTNQGKEAKKTNSNLINEKTALKNKRPESNIAFATNRKSISVPVKDKKAEILKTNNIMNKVKKFKAESSLKKLFSENPLLKANKNKSENKGEFKPEESVAEKSVELKENNNEDITMSEEKNELLNESANKNKSGSKQKTKNSDLSGKEEEKIIYDNIKESAKKSNNKILKSNELELNRNLLNSMKSMKKESSFKNNYMGKGREGLDDDVEMELTDQEPFLSEDPLAQLNKNNLPTFSEGYLFQKFLSENETLEDSIFNNPPKLKINSEEILKSSENILDSEKCFDDENFNVNAKRAKTTRFSPSKKPVTTKLSTAIKASYKKNKPLDTELKLLSKEFRYLLSGKLEKAKQTQDLLQEKLQAKKENEKIEELNQIEKKLDFLHEQSESNQNFYAQSQGRKNSESDSQYENMNEEEIANLENDILQKVLEENFGFKNFFPAQLDTIKNILNYKSTLTILPPGAGKSLCYQLPSLVLEGLTIVVCPLLASITDQLTNLPGCLSGASLTTFTNQTQRQEIMTAIALKKIKILFITPERLALENFSELIEIDISLICFDDAICCSPLSQNFRSSYISILSMLPKLRPNSVLLLGNNITNLIERSLTELFRIPKENVLRRSLVFPQNFKISVSKDENKLSNLVKLLRNSNLKSAGTILIFCNLRKQVDKVTSFLNQNGLSASAHHAGKSEIERQMIQNNFLNDKIKILVATAGFCNGIAKVDIRCVILFDMPASIDLFYQQLSRGGRDRKEAYVHVFLKDEDYFIQRNMIYLDNIDKANVRKFVENLFSQCYTKSNHCHNNLNKVDSINNNNINVNNEASNNNNNENTNSNIFQVINEVHNDNETEEPNTNAKNNSNERAKLFRKSYDLPKRISFNFNKISEITGIKKNMQIYLLLRLLNDRKINSNEAVELITDGKLKAECLGIGPTDIHLRFFKRAPHDLAAEEPNLRLILESSRELVGGVFKFSTGEVCQKLGITYVDLINYLYCFQNEGEIGYETKDEGMFINIEKIPENISEIVDYLYYTNKYLVNLNIKKLNASYSLFRKYAATSVDCFSFNKSEKIGAIRCLSVYNDYKSYEEAFRKNFDLYFDVDENLCDILIAGNDNELAVLIPIISVDSQREKANIQKDLEDFTKKEFDKNNSINSIDLINVLLGINIESKGLYLSNPLWGKYQQYDYNDLLEIIEATLGKIKTDFASKNPLVAQANKKKNK